MTQFLAGGLLLGAVITLLAAIYGLRVFLETRRFNRDFEALREHQAQAMAMRRAREDIGWAEVTVR